MSTKEFQYLQIQALQKKCSELQDKIDMVAELLENLGPPTEVQTKSLQALFESWKDID